MVQVGDKIPNGTLQYVPYTPNEDLMACPVPQAFNIHEEFKGQKVALFAIPGPFTPTCSNTHVPGFIAAHDALKQKGVSKIVCLSVSDGFVMNAYAKAINSQDKVLMVGDGSAEYTKTLGLDQDLSANGMGIRSKRFAIIIDDLTVTYVGVETERGVSVSGADAVLSNL